jgi:hypothetical protein
VFFGSSAVIVLEDVALRHQLLVLQRSGAEWLPETLFRRIVSGIILVIGVLLFAQRPT